MPTWFYIVIGFILLIALLLSLKINLVIAYKGRFSVYLKILFIKIRLFPEKEKKPSKKKQPKKADVAPKSDSAPKSKEDKGNSTVSALLDMKDVIFRLTSDLFDKLHFKFIKIHASIGCEDASKTALAYGAAIQSTAYIIELLSNISNVEMSRSSDIDIRADFITQKSWLELNCILYMRVLSILSIGIKALKAFFKFKNKQEKLLEVKNNGTIKTK